MTNLRVDGSVPVDVPVNVSLTAPVHLEGEGAADLAALRGDCARMAPHWTVPDRIVSLPVSPSLIHGVSVPSRSARLLDGMSEYGN
ncbi:hypothetical protein JHN63_50250 [Streptomyces sp. MBT65]|uniref:hypothetical protein n=1 Tax=Streptomyces sp. MBT65 TaxID=1488395 RepID=UPI00190D8072|nr:hypothetical protein [Streptomyces sp. MBT65]MBK3581799.1 hypothetical protein [Streptomyces sp. MBT65]